MRGSNGERVGESEGGRDGERKDGDGEQESQQNNFMDLTFAEFTLLPPRPKNKMRGTSIQ